MAVRLEQSNQVAAAYTRRSGLNGVQRAGIGELAKVVDEQQPLGDQYRGPTAVMDMSFTGTPGLRGPIKATVLGIDSIADKVLRIEIWQDTEPLFDRYRVRVTLAGDYAIPPEGLEGEGVPDEGEISGIRARGVQGIGALPLLFIPAIATALGILGILGVIAWRVYKASWGSLVAGGSALLLVAGAVAIGGIWLLRGR